MAVSLVPLSPLSEDFGRIEYELQLQLNAPKLVVSECYDLSNPHVSAQFMTFCKTMTPQNNVQVFIPTSELQQPISDIAAKGIRVDPKRGLKFRVGSINIDKSSESIELIRATIALGSALNFQATTNPEIEHFLPDVPTSTYLKTGYNSLCISEYGEYVIFNNGQVKVNNLVRFAGGDNLAEASEEDDICEICQENKATVWCVNDSAKLCAKCDHDSHAGNRILQRHKRMSLQESRGLMEFCPLHKDVRVEYYCPQCQVPVCLKCKMTGSHSKGDAASHPLIPINQAYTEAVEAAAHEDPIIVRRKSAIREKIDIADSRLREIIENATEVEQEIWRIADAAIKHAKELAGEKALIIRSAKTELLRKESELDTLSKFIACHKNTSGPLNFLRAFDRQNEIVGMMQGTGDLPLDLKVEGDLCVFGNLDVSPADMPVKKQRRPETPERAPSPVPEPEPEPEPVVTERAAEIPKKQASPQGSPRKRSMKRRSDINGPEYTSLVALAQRREQKNLARGLELSFQPFHGSAILTMPAQGTALYLCFPFKNQPQTHLLFSTERDGRSIKEMHQRIDGIGITAVLIKKGEFIFGGFAAAKWNSSGEPFGEGSSSFLFSVSQDAFIPFKPKVADACLLWASEDSLTFGRYDLILADDFDGCSAMLENSYGIGFPQGSTEAQTFLAGEPNFRADVVEVWGFFTTEDE